METLQIFNVQHYSVHDGPGIRTTVFLKGCPLRCQWCCNPESQSAASQLRYSNVRCRHCGNCIQSCTHQAITNQNGQLFFDFKKCANCQDKTCLSTCYHYALTLIGTQYTTEELLELILKDKSFYDNSGGGVTFSGGEPFAQATGLLELLTLCKHHHVHTAVETCGFVDSTILQQLLPYIDLFLFDLKIMDNANHIIYTKQSNELILKNLELLTHLNANIIGRVPLIPDATDTTDNINAIIDTCLRYHINEVNLEIYHNLGVQKYSDYGIHYCYKEPEESRSNDYYLSILEKFKAAGIRCEYL